MRYRSLLLGMAIITATAASVVGVVNAAQYQHESPAPALQNPIVLSSTPERGQTITVHVPRTALLKVDDDGMVVAAATNTGAAPQSGDDVYLIHPDGTVEPSDTFDLGSVQWVGDFSRPGSFQPQN